MNKCKKFCKSFENTVTPCSEIACICSIELRNGIKEAPEISTRVNVVLIKILRRIKNILEKIPEICSIIFSRRDSYILDGNIDFFFFFT